MKTFFAKSKYKDYGLLLLGTAIMAVGIKSIMAPNGMVTGGFSGLAIIIQNLTKNLIKGGIPLWFTTLVLNIPLFIFAVKIKGKDFVAKSLFGALILSLWLFLIPQIDLIGSDYILAAVIGGSMEGIGIGLVFLARGTTGGVDTVSALIQHRLRHYSISQILQVIDASIIVMGMFVFGLRRAMYAVIAIFIVAKISDGLIEGLKFAKTAYIITEHYEEVASGIMNQINRGVTGITVKGMYSKAEKNMLFCVVSKKQIVQLKDLVKQIDPNAFVIVTDAREVLGEGFIEEMSQK
ncbi:MAG TPA: YitT family protein [Lachnospiraceae bacterium]